jgi:hypothetical protein
MTTKITCPKCGCEIDVNNILLHQLEEQHKKKLQEEIDAIHRLYQNRSEALTKEKEQLAVQQKELESRVQNLVATKVKAERLNLETALKSKIAEENADRLAAMERELQEKSAQVKELNKAKAEIERINREKSELKEAIQAEAERRLNEQLAEEKNKIRRQEQEKSELKIRELVKQLEDQKELTEQMKRKQEQGSMQLQGEVQELAIEDWLKSHFIGDDIVEIKKGERGADCLQVVNTREKLNCGKIYYESKRAQAFGKNWIDVFKNDLRDKGADVGVLVTKVYPAGMERMGNYQGIWVCSFEEFKGLCFVLRESLIQINLAVASQENKGEKMAMLYDLLMSTQFKRQIVAIIDTFTAMKTTLEKEKRATQASWATREQQIENVVINTIQMWGSIKGIAGKDLGTIDALELGEG